MCTENLFVSAVSALKAANSTSKRLIYKVVIVSFGSLLVMGTACRATTIIGYGIGGPPVIPNTEVTIYHGVIYGGAQDICKKSGKCSPPGAEYSYVVKTGKLEKVPGSPGLSAPDGALVEMNGTLYGTSNSNGTNGTIFKIDPLTRTATILYTFTGGDDGAFPGHGLTVLGGVLYGVTQSGPSGTTGTIFKFDPASNTKTIVHNLVAAEGSAPQSRLIAKGSVLYGAASKGGANNEGSVFSVDTVADSFATIYSFDASNSAGYNPAPWLCLHGNNLFGYSVATGKNFRIKAQIYEINLESGRARSFYRFTANQLSNKGDPNGEFVYLNGSLYGTSPGGGSNDDGTVFSVNIKTRQLTEIYDFPSSPNTVGAEPDSGLTYYRGSFYGATLFAGTTGLGTVFKLTP